MKKITILLMAALLTLGLAQCKKDDPTPEGEKVSIRLKIVDNSQDDGSKAGISPWADGAVTPGPGDQIAVAYNGKFRGMLHYYNEFFINDDLYIEPNGDQKLYFYFLGNRGSFSASATSGTFSIADQSETYAVLSYGESTTNFDGEGTYYAELHNYCGLLKFNLETEVPVDVPVSVLGMNNAVTVNFSGQTGSNYEPFTFSMVGTGDVTLNAFTNPETNAVERWVILPMQARVTNATANATGYGYTPEFTVPPVIKNMYYNQGVDVPAFDASIVPSINHYFSVSAGTSVYFAPGNLQYKDGTGWRFAENQWDNIGTWDATDWVDHFGWGMWTGNYNPLNTSENSDSYNWSSADFIKTLINNDETGWRTLTRDEWNYVLNTRSTISGIRYAKATVNDVMGLILLPDTWTASTYALSNTNSSGASFDSNVISASQWSTLQDAGAVFLPVGGRRNGTTFNDTGDGYYWEKNTYPRALYFKSSVISVDGQYNNSKYYGMSVRLARNVEGPGALPNCTVTVSANPSVGGSATVSESTVQTGKYCTVTATEASGCSTFINWTVNGNEVSTSNPYEFQVTGDIELVANFDVPTYEITATVDPTEGGSVEGAGTYYCGEECTLIATATDGYHFEGWTDGSTQVSLYANYSFTVNGDKDLVANFSETPSIVIDPYFSVSSSKKVYFSPGNLQYKHNETEFKWRFAEHQWDYVGSANVSGTSVATNIWIDLFGWGLWTGDNPNPIQTAAASSNYIFQSLVDFNKEDLLVDPEQRDYDWKTLTRDEWDYVLNSRSTTSGIRYAKAQVHSVDGVILLPDTWTASTYALSNTNTADASFASNVISDSDWSTLEDAGAVFLPCARYVYNSSGKCYYQSSSRGYYWSATYYNGNNAYYLYFSTSSVNPSSNDQKWNRNSVRLVRDAN